MILNLTQHKATPEQVSAGVVEPTSKKYIQDMLTFEGLPSGDVVFHRAQAIADYAEVILQDRPDDDDVIAAMVGGAPYLMPLLWHALKDRGITPLFAFSMRECVETPNEDGSVSKTMIFRHKGFVEV